MKTLTDYLEESLRINRNIVLSSNEDSYKKFKDKLKKNSSLQMHGGRRTLIVHAIF